MTRLMACAYCAFNALVFLSVAVACGLLLAGILQPTLLAAGAGCVTALCGMVNLTSVFFASRARTRPWPKAVEEEKPALTPGQMLANQRWSRRA
jgi:hypothetical protein